MIVFSYNRGLQPRTYEPIMAIKVFLTGAPSRLLFDKLIYFCYKKKNTIPLFSPRPKTILAQDVKTYSRFGHQYQKRLKPSIIKYYIFMPILIIFF